MNDTTYDLSNARKAYSRIGFALCAILLLATACQALVIYVPELIWGEDNWLNTSSFGKWITSFAPIYLVAMPVGMLIMKSMPSSAPEDKKLRKKEFFIFLPICFCLMYGGNIIGNLLSMILSGGNAQNDLINYVFDTNPLKILVMVILAPLFEEFIFRRLIIDRTARYGEKTAVLLSALTFALLHQNLYQFFYAFGLGLVFAYIYIRTGRLRYTVILHAIINFMGSVLAPWLLSLLDFETITNLDPNATTEEMAEILLQVLPGLVLYFAYAVLLMVVSIIGLVLLALKCRKLIWKTSAEQLPDGNAAKTAYLNVGMIIYTLLCAVSIVLALFL